MLLAILNSFDEKGDNISKTSVTLLNTSLYGYWILKMELVFVSTVLQEAITYNLG
jgi:hypothetical protein